MPIPFILVGLALAAGAYGVAQAFEDEDEDEDDSVAKRERNATIRNAAQQVGDTAIEEVVDDFFSPD